MYTSGGTAAAADFDGDGDQDLFVGGRIVPGKYPYAPRSYVLRNENGKFVDATDIFGATDIKQQCKRHIYPLASKTQSILRRT